MSGTITFDELFPVTDNPNTGFRLFGFNQAEGLNEAITISQIIALLELTAPAWSEITGKPTSFPPSAHSFGSHSQVDPSVDTAPDGRLLRRQGGVWAPWIPNFLTSETDPTVPGHVKGITETEKANWNSAFAWGNHAGNYRPVNWVPSWSQVTDKPTSFPASAHSLGSHSNVDSAIDSATVGQLVRRGATKFEAWTPNFLTSETDPVFGASPAASITIGEIALWNAKLSEWSEFPENTIPMIKDGISIPSGLTGVWSENPFDPETEPEDYDAFVSELLYLISTKRIKGPDAVDADDYVTKAQLDSLGGGSGDNGWSPILTLVTDGSRRVLQVSDWTGGQGTKPATGQYIGAAGLTSTIGDAVDIRGTDGEDGREVQFQTSSTHIQWRYVGEATWTNLVALSTLKGEDGREIQLQASGTWLQWRYVTDLDWTNLFDLSTLGGGSGVPPGGTTGQVLTKNSNDDGDASWQDPTGGGAAAANAGSRLYLFNNY